MEDNFSTDVGREDGFGMIQRHYIYRVLYVILHQIHLISSGIRSQRLGMCALRNTIFKKNVLFCTGVQPINTIVIVSGEE